jgi:Fic family protein
MYIYKKIHLMQILKLVDEKQNELELLHPINPSDKKRLDEKFRLEFNYNSNHLEGNTITYTDTKALLLKDLVLNQYTMRELEEMKAHDIAFQLITQWAKEDSRPLAEIDLKELNKIILVKPFYKDAKTLSGDSTRKLIKVGEYKEQPNSVILQNGEIFHYAEPLEVPAKMQELIEWYRMEKSKMHAVELAAKFHHKFVLIHPFDDGNGRISRLLVNYILINNNLPPIVIKSIEKKKYLEALALADIGNIDAFTQFIGQQVLWSLDLYIKAAKGESIEESNDWEKELAIIKKKSDNLPPKRNEELLENRLINSFFPLINKLHQIAKKDFSDLFDEMKVFYRSADTNLMGYLDVPVNTITPNFLLKSNMDIIELIVTFLRFKKNGANTFEVQITTKIVIQDYTYKIMIENTGQILITKQINEDINEDEATKVCNAFGQHIVNAIKKSIKN